MKQRLRHLAVRNFHSFGRRAICCLLVFAALLSDNGRPAEAAEVVVGDWGDLGFKFQDSPNDTTFKLGEDIDIDVYVGDSLAVPVGISYTLDLAGHQLQIVSMTATSPAIKVPASSSLTIVDSVGGGMLVADSSLTISAAGIGGNDGENGGAITIESGTVIAKGGATAAGIGSGGCLGINCEFSTGPITISGGTVEATGGVDGAGIGGGLEHDGGMITISGGNITAIGGLNAAGIGGGTYAHGGTIVIYDGSIHATGGDFGGAGIGGGSTADWGNITINGGTLTATGGAMAAGIGGGAFDFGGSITINGGDVTATGRETDLGTGIYGGAGIGGGGFGNDVGSVTVTAGTVRATGAVNAAAIGGGTDAKGSAVDIQGGVVIVSGPGGHNGTLIGAGARVEFIDFSDDFGSLSNAGTITVAEGGKLWIPPGETFTNSGTVNGAGEIEIDGTIVNTGTIEVDSQTGNNIYVISFNLNGADGTVPPNMTLFAATVQEAGESLPEPSRTGYVFDGWYTAASGGEKVTETDTISDGMILYAHWTAIPYTVTFDLNDGSGTTSSVTVDFGQTVSEPAEPTRIGYTFIGWFTDSTDAASEWDFDTDTVSGDVPLYAHWMAIPYTVTFDWNDGSGSTDSDTVDFGQIVSEPAAPTRIGYTFIGWFSDPTDAASEWDFDADTVSGDVTLYAHWTINSYTVTFDLNDGSGMTSLVTVEHGELLSEPTEPTRTGYTFVGWFTDPEDATSGWDFDVDSVSEGMTLYAHWTINLYTVTFDLNGGNGTVSPVMVEHGELLSEPTETTRIGYTFVGWFTDSTDEASGWDFDEGTVSGAITLYAHWTINSYTVSFDANGGSGAVSPVMVEHGELLSEPSEPTRIGYTFVGWFTDPENEASGWDFDTDTVSTDVMLYAYWTINRYTVTFDANGGSGTVSPVTVEHGEPVGVPTEPTRTGYTFVGWFTDSTDEASGWDFDEGTVSGAITLYAHWTINSYTVTFDANGGSGALSPVTVEHGELLSEPTEPTRTGYTFVGWFTDPEDATSGWDFDVDSVSEGMTLYAHWTINLYTVTFDLNGGNGTVSPVTVEHGQLVGVPTEPTRIGYTFVGWFTDLEDTASGWDFDADNVNEDVTLYAHWTINRYTVTFDLNGGSGTVSPVMVEHGELLSEPSEPTRIGYTFVGWFTDLEDTASGWDFDTDTVSGDVTLYAHWTINRYTVMFDTNGGSGTLSPVTVEHGELLSEPAEPMRTGYTFVGWFTDLADETSEWDFDTDTISSGVTLYAHWTINRYTVTFDLNGGSGTASPVTLEHGELLTKPSEPTRTGYTFVGWFTDPTDAASGWDFEVDTVSAAMTLYVHWKVRESPDSGGSYNEPNPPVKDAENSASITLNGVAIEVRLTEEISAEGQRFVRLTFTREQLLEALASGTADIAITVEGLGPAVKVDFPAATLLEASRDRSDASLQLTVNGNGVLIPFAAVGKLPVEAMLTATIAQASEAVSSAAANSIDSAGTIRLLEKPIVFALDADGRRVEGWHNRYMQRMIALPSSVSPDKATVVRIDASGASHFVPAVFSGDKVNMYSLQDGTYTVIQSSETFTDVQSHWALADIELLANKRIVAGRPDGGFMPDAPITRAEFASLIVRALGLQEERVHRTFTDVSADDWYAQAVITAQQEGLIRGYEDGSFRPDATITREQITTMIARALAYAEKSPQADKTALAAFADGGDIADWAAEAVAQLIQAGIIRGVTETVLAPGASASRAESTVMLKRMLQYMQFINTTM